MNINNNKFEILHDDNDDDHNNNYEIYENIKIEKSKNKLEFIVKHPIKQEEHSNLNVKILQFCGKFYIKLNKNIINIDILFKMKNVFNNNNNDLVIQYHEDKHKHEQQQIIIKQCNIELFYVALKEIEQLQN